MAAKTRTGGGRLSLRACRIGLPDDGAAGWFVFYARHLIAIVSQGPDGRVVLSAGFADPFVCVMIDWPDLEAARADFTAAARLYRAGVAPGMIGLEFSGNGG